MGCGTSRAAPSDGGVELKSAGGSEATQTVDIPFSALGTYQVEVGNGAPERTTVTPEGLIWRAYPVVAAVLDSARGALVFRCGLESLSVHFDGSLGKLSGWHRTSDEHDWTPVKGTRIAAYEVGGLPKTCVTDSDPDSQPPPPPLPPANFSQNALQEYIEIRGDMDRLADAETKVDLAEHLVEYLGVRVSDETELKQKTEASLKGMGGAKGDHSSSLQAKVTHDAAAARLEGLIAEKNAAARELASAKLTEMRYNELRSQEQALLEAVFGQKYGSSVERELEMQDAQCTAFANRVKAVKDSWSGAGEFLGTGSLSVVRATSTLSDIIRTHPKCGNDVPTDDITNLQLYVLDGYYKLARVWFFLPNTPLPHLGGEHLSALFDIGTTIPTRVRTPEGAKETSKYLDDLAKRSARAQLWVSNVIQKRILVDSERATQEMARARDALRAEREKLIAAHITSKFGVEHNSVIGFSRGRTTLMQDATGMDSHKDREAMQEKLAALERMLREATADNEKLSREITQRVTLEVPTSDEIGLNTSALILQHKVHGEKVEEELDKNRYDQQKMIKAKLDERRQQQRANRRASLKKR